MADLSADFAARILAIGPPTLDREDHEQVARLLYDVAGCAYGGTRQSTVAALVRWAQPYAGAGKAGVISSGVRVPGPVAALVNGTAAHSYELDDTHDPSMSHPASVVIPAALAVAAECGSTGGDFLAAVVAGYEAMTRIGTAANASHVIEFGFHPTALFGGFGAAAAAAKLRGLDSEGLRCAWGHALSMASGSMQFSDETTGTAVKRRTRATPRSRACCRWNLPWPGSRRRSVRSTGSTASSSSMGARRDPSCCGRSRSGLRSTTSASSLTPAAGSSTR